LIARFWGVRGSIPSPMTSEEITSKVERAVRRVLGKTLDQDGGVKQYVGELPRYIKGTYGGNTPCIELQHAEAKAPIVFDAGTGIRRLGVRLMEDGFSAGNGTIHLFLSHTHWDHIQGFPFFPPAYVAGNRIRVYSPLPDMEERLSAQQTAEFFPVPLDAMQADVEFVHLAEGETVRVGEVEIGTAGLNHPGGSYAYRAESNGETFVYASDTEFTDLADVDLAKYVSFFFQAKVLVFDSQYTLLQAMEKADWGHSSSVKGVDLAHEAGAETLVLFHHEPSHDDRALWELLHRTRKYAEMRGLHETLRIIMAYEGLELEI